MGPLEIVVKLDSLITGRWTGGGGGGGSFLASWASDRDDGVGVEIAWGSFEGDDGCEGSCAWKRG